jgi:hypothetical protein
MWIAAGACCFAMVAEVDAGIIFRQRPGIRRSRVTYQSTNTGRSTAAPAATAATAAATPADTTPADTAATTSAEESTGVSATRTTTATRVRRRGILGRRRGTVVTSSQVAATTGGGMTSDQTPDTLACRQYHSGGTATQLSSLSENQHGKPFAAASQCNGTLATVGGVPYFLAIDESIILRESHDFQQRNDLGARWPVPPRRRNSLAGDCHANVAKPARQPSRRPPDKIIRRL